MIDARCDLIGACGRKDQEGLRKKLQDTTGRGKPAAEMIQLLAHHLPTMPAPEEFSETEALVEEPISQATTATCSLYRTQMELNCVLDFLCDPPDPQRLPGTCKSSVGRCQCPERGVLMTKGVSKAL